MANWKPLSLLSEVIWLQPEPFKSVMALMLVCAPVRLTHWPVDERTVSPVLTVSALVLASSWCVGVTNFQRVLSL